MNVKIKCHNIYEVPNTVPGTWQYSREKEGRTKRNGGGEEDGDKWRERERE